MAAISNFLSDELFDHVFRNAAYTAPTTVYACLVGTTEPLDSDDGSTIDELTQLMAGGAELEALEHELAEATSE